MSIAFSNFPFAIRLTYAFTLIPAGHAFEHSGRFFSSIIYSSLFPFIKTPVFAPISDSELKNDLFNKGFFSFRDNPHL